MRFTIDRDPEMKFRFLAIQFEKGRAFAEAMGVSPDAPQTNVVILHGRAWFKSDAALTVLSQFRSTRYLGLLKGVPRWLRNPVYDLIAQNRYQVFGRTDVCMVPSPADRARFL